VLADRGQSRTLDGPPRSEQRRDLGAGTTKATYTTRPDKEPPLWNICSQVIYWWTATEVDRDRAYIIVYDGKMWPRAKSFGPAYLAFRCVKQP
jgi:hypothetical protein